MSEPKLTLWEKARIVAIEARGVKRAAAGIERHLTSTAAQSVREQARRRAARGKQQHPGDGVQPPSCRCPRAPDRPTERPENQRDRHPDRAATGRPQDAEPNLQDAQDAAEDVEAVDRPTTRSPAG